MTPALERLVVGDHLFVVATSGYGASRPAPTLVTVDVIRSGPKRITVADPRQSWYRNIDVDDLGTQGCPFHRTEAEAWAAFIRQVEGAVASAQGEVRRLHLDLGFARAALFSMGSPAPVDQAPPFTIEALNPSPGASVNPIGTPRPWRVDYYETFGGETGVRIVGADGEIVADDQPYYPQAITEANAHLIVRAVTALPGEGEAPGPGHDALMAALDPKTVAGWIDEAWGNDGESVYAHQNLAESVVRHLRTLAGRTP